MQPQAASLAVGTVQIAPVIKGRKLKADRRMKVTLSCDLRDLDGPKAPNSPNLEGNLGESARTGNVLIIWFLLTSI
jgi:pyruvate/2-oxoglutarate dehydrogenase complex dihydrolipoamide acyltransferase (E2) component